MRQSRMMSLVEAGANLVVGYGVAVVTQLLVSRLFELKATLAQNLAIGLICTAVSMARSYVRRRAFEAILAAPKANAPQQLWEAAHGSIWLNGLGNSRRTGWASTGRHKVC